MCTTSEVARYIQEVKVNQDLVSLSVNNRIIAIYGICDIARYCNVCGFQIAFIESLYQSYVMESVS